MKDHELIRIAVSEDYARAIGTTGGSCCGGSVVPKGVVAKLAGYTDEDFAALPIDAVVSSFGCGNPLAFSEVRPGEVVLDLGSGAGIDLLLAAKKVGASGRVIGVDMTDDMIARARANAVAAGLTNVEVRKGIIEELPVEDASVDWVISNCVINLSPEKQRVFAEIARVLTPGGRMLVSDIVAEDVPGALKEDRRLYSSCLTGAIGEAEYLEGLRAAGLTDVEVRDRLVYDEAQIEALVGSELSGGSGCCCGGPTIPSDFSRQVVRQLAGKVASVKVSARKPVQPRP